MTTRFGLYMLLSSEEKAAYNRGFTLIELLISMIIAGLVTSGLLYLVNEVIRIDRREARLESVQQDMQRAINYITDELQESVYVYSTPADVANRLTPSDLPSGTVAPTPVLAFWKPERLTAEEYEKLPGDCNELTAPADDNCQTLKLRQSYYSLIIYFALANANDNPNWSGQTRIVRYVLPQYTRNILTAGTAVQTSGFEDPANNFAAWSPTSGTNTGGNWAVLTDYVDSTQSAFGSLLTPANRTITPPDISGGCSEFGTGYARAPVNTGSDSFVACIGQPGVAGNGSNQDVIVLLRGNIKTARQEADSPTVASSSLPNGSVLPTLKTQVLVRGATNKNPGGTN